MNIIFKISIIIILLVSSFGKLQAEKDSIFSMNIQLGIGYIENIKQDNPYFKFKVGKNFFYPSLRLMWEPDNYLNLGFQTAYIIISKVDEKNINTDFGKTNLSIITNAIPAILIFNMNLWGININGGLGTSYTISNLKSFNETIITDKWISTYYVSLGYSYHLFDRLKIGLEGEFYSFSEIRSRLLSLKLKAGFDIIKW